jgi:MFS family permease
MSVATYTAAPPGHVRAEDMPLRRRVGSFAFITVIYFFYAWSFNTVDILRPYIAEDLKLSIQAVSYIYTAQSIGALLGAIVNAQLADRFGRRNALFVVTVAFGLCLASGALVTSYEQVLAQRFALGYFTGSMFPIAVGLYPGLFEQRRRGLLAGLLLCSYNFGVIVQGEAGRYLLDHDWKLLLWVGLIPAALAPLVFLFVPNDRKIVPWGGASGGVLQKLPFTELFQKRYRTQTLLVITMTGLNFFAYQAFSGWHTTYLKDELGLGGDAIGKLVSAAFIGGLIGSLSWGLVADRLGRRANAFSFFVVAAIICLYLTVPLGVGTRWFAIFAFGFFVSASVIWGPWLAELYPTHLRSTAASLFNYGRIISFAAPPLTAALSTSIGLPGTMAIGAPIFIVAALVWLRLPETLEKKQPAAAPAA